MAIALETLNFPWISVAAEGQGSLMVGAVERDLAFAAGGEAGRVRQVIAVVDSGRDAEWAHVPIARQGNAPPGAAGEARRPICPGRGAAAGALDATRARDVRAAALPVKLPASKPLPAPIAAPRPPPIAAPAAAPRAAPTAALSTPLEAEASLGV